MSLSGSLIECESINMSLTSKLMTLYGTQINSNIAETNDCKNVSALCMFNLKKKRNVRSNYQRKNLARKLKVPWLKYLCRRKR